MASDGVTLFAYAADGTVWTSLDGENFNSQPGEVVLRDVLYDNGLFIGVGEQLASSSDGLTWQAQPMPDVHAIAKGNGQFMAASPTQIFITPDGQNWETVTTGTTLIQPVIAWDGSQWWLFGEDPDNSQRGLIFFSSNGQSWAEHAASKLYPPMRGQVRDGWYVYLTGKNTGVLRIWNNFLSELNPLWPETNILTFVDEVNDFYDP